MITNKKDAWLSLKIFLACAVATPGVFILLYGGEDAKEIATAAYITLGLFVIVMLLLIWWVWKGRKNSNL